MRDRKNKTQSSNFFLNTTKLQHISPIHKDALPAKAGSCARTLQKANDKRAETNACAMYNKRAGR